MLWFFVLILVYCVFLGILTMDIEPRDKWNKPDHKKPNKWGV